MGYRIGVSLPAWPPLVRAASGSMLHDRGGSVPFFTLYDTRYTLDTLGGVYSERLG